MTRKKRNKIIESVFINRIGYGGVGIGELENKKKVLIKGNIIPGWTVKCFITKQRKDYIEAKTIEVLDKGKQELICPKCPHYNNLIEKQNIEKNESIVGCGGCKWQILSYEQQLKLKMKLVLDCFRHQTNILQNTNFCDILGTQKEYFYRNKIEFSFGKYIKKETNNELQIKNNNLNENKQKFSIKEEFQIGFHKQGMFSKVVDVEKCFLISEKANNLYKYIKNLCKESGLPVHDQKLHEGFFRHLVIREGFNTKQILINLVIYSEYLNDQKKQELWNKFKQNLLKDDFLKNQINTFCITENNGLADIVKGEKHKLTILWGEGVIFEELNFIKNGQNVEKTSKKEKNIEAIIEDGQIKITKKNSDGNDNKKISKKDFFELKVSFRISPFSFFQTNTHGAELLFKTAFDLIGDIRGNIFDLYCGAGTIGLSLLKQGKGNFLIGIEIIKDAIIDAQYNAKINGVEDKTYFVSGRTEDLIYSDLILQEKIQNLGLIIVDPPRDGLHKNVIKFLNNLKKQQQTKLLYISCNPVTMARDLGLLFEGGWKIDTLQPVDMFPQTHHVEMIGILR